MDQKRIAESGSRLHSYGDSKTEEFLKSEAGRSLLKLIRDDNKSHFLTEAKRIFENDSDALDRSTVSKLLRLCCASDSVDCASALLNGDLAIVPPVNEMDESGRSVLHIAADKHAARCIELLLQNHARTDLKTIDERAQLALDLSLSSNRMDVKWAPDKNSVEDLVVALSGKEWSAVRFLVENTKELSEVAYANAVKGCVVGLAALLIVAENKVKELTVELHDAISGAKEKMTLYEFIISKALSLAHATTPSTMARHSSSTEAESENAEIRKLLLCEIKLLQLFGADVPTSSTVMRMTLPLIRAVQAGDEAITELILKTKVDISDADVEGNSALHLCLMTSRVSSSQRMKILNLLLEHGAEVRQKNNLGVTAIHIAAANDNTMALEVLISFDPEAINFTTETEETPLFFAVKNDNVECAELLLNLGANTEALNLGRQRPVDLAESQKMRSMLILANIINIIKCSLGNFFPFGSCDKGTERKNLSNLQKHVNLEALAKKMRNSSVFFLREFDFYKNYDASIKEGKCFVCNMQKMLWVNSPCKHKLWCSDCKPQDIIEVSSSENKCVICDTVVKRTFLDTEDHHQSVIVPKETCLSPGDDGQFVVVPRETRLNPGDDSQSIIFQNKEEEFPPFSPELIRSLSKKKKKPLHG